MIYRLDVILEDGTRRRANYDTDVPDVIEMNKFRFGAKDVMLSGAYFVTTSGEAKRVLQDNGFNTRRPQKMSNFCVRLDSEVAEEISAIARSSGKKDAAVIRVAIEYWLKNGHPME